VHQWCTNGAWPQTCKMHQWGLAPDVQNVEVGNWCCVVALVGLMKVDPGYLNINSK